MEFLVLPSIEYAPYSRHGLSCNNNNNNDNKQDFYGGIPQSPGDHTNNCNVAVTKGKARAIIVMLLLTSGSPRAIDHLTSIPAMETNTIQFQAN